MSIKTDLLEFIKCLVAEVRDEKFEICENTSPVKCGPFKN